MIGIISMALFGALCGLGFLNVMALIAKNGSNPRDYVEFESQQDVYAVVDAWAVSHGYVLKRNQGVHRTYQKGSGFLTAPMFLELDRSGEKYTLSSYVRINGFLIQGDMALGGGGFMAKMPRSTAKKAQNQLFEQLQLAPLV
ncbi:MAG: hypothetical protein ACREP7_23615 [Lysobacter sp.]